MVLNDPVDQKIATGIPAVFLSANMPLPIVRHLPSFVKDLKVLVIATSYRMPVIEAWSAMAILINYSVLSLYSSTELLISFNVMNQLVGFAETVNKIPILIIEIKAGSSHTDNNIEVVIDKAYVTF